MSAFPAIGEPPLSPATDSPSAQQRGTLLVVDDERDVRDSLWFVFKDQYRILLASDGTEAIRVAHEQRIDVAVIDIRMVGLSGIETCAELKKIDPATQVIILTAYEALESARAALRLGASDYLGKPYDLQVIRGAVAFAMERRAIAKQIRDQEGTLRDLREQVQNQQVREQLARSRTEIYASVLHDINGPLTIISGFIEMVHDDLARAELIQGADLNAVRTHVAGIRRQVNNCLDIARRYLGFLRGGKGGAAGVGINQLFADLAQLLKGHPAARGHRLAIVPLTNDAQARINGTDLLQVLLNLTINAFQCTRQPHQVMIDGRRIAGTELTSEFAEDTNGRWINYDPAKSANSLLVLNVKDTGPGMSAETLAHIFDSYFTTKGSAEGTGLGLSIVRRLVEQAGGAIHVQSTVGAGTTFTVYLPM